MVDFLRSRDGVSTCTTCGCLVDTPMEGRHRDWHAEGDAHDHSDALHVNIVEAPSRIQPLSVDMHAPGPWHGEMLAEPFVVVAYWARDWQRVIGNPDFPAPDFPEYPRDT